MSDHHEIERTFTVDSRTTMPDLAGVGAGRDEVPQPLGETDGDGADEQVPAALRDLVRAYAGGQELGVVATIGTRRTTSELLDIDDAVLAEVCDDEVTGRLPDGPTVGCTRPGWRAAASDRRWPPTGRWSTPR